MVHSVSEVLQTMTNRSARTRRQPALAMELVNDRGQLEQAQRMDAAWKKSEEIRVNARKALVDLDSNERLQRALRARPRRARESCVFDEGEPVFVWRLGKRGSQAKVPCGSTQGRRRMGDQSRLSHGQPGGATSAWLCGRGAGRGFRRRSQKRKNVDLDRCWKKYYEGKPVWSNLRYLLNHRYNDKHHQDQGASGEHPMPCERHHSTWYTDGGIITHG